ncbi:MAG TPA: SIMPL domain-containing protein [Bryobacteraceae bacterium]|nr:SIMPL domain-containing protein [Bryobacteraceae bacterium]
MAAYAANAQTTGAHMQSVEGVTVIGEAVRRVSPDHAEFPIEISANAATAAQALRDNQLKFTQVAQALQPLGVQAGDLHAISQSVVNLYAPVTYGPTLPVFGMPQIGQPGFAGFGMPPGMLSGPVPEVQFGSYQARNVFRVNVREAGRAGEILDAATRAGANIAGTFQFRASDEATARRSTLEAAGKDARQKAEALASAAGKKIGEPIAITEELIGSNGAYTAMRSAMPFAFGAGTPHAAGELEYYARVSASFRLQ